MPLHFQEPALLWCAAVAAAPLLAHLASRTRPPRKSFPAVEFLQRAVRRTWRWRQPRDWLLLVLRTLAVAALALAFPRPVWLGGERVAGAEEGKHLVLLVDRTASMQAVEQGQSRFSMARARALEVLRTAGRLDSVNLVWLDATPRAVYPAMGRAVQPLEAALRDSPPAMAAGNAAGALRLALEKLQTTRGGVKELVVVSDFQAETWKEALPPMPAEVRLLRLPVAGEMLPNLALAGLEASPAAPFAGETFAVSCRVLNHSPGPRSAQVSVTLGGQRQSRVVETGPWAESQVIFTLSAPAAGEVLLQATAQAADAEALGQDNTRRMSLKIREGLQVARLLPEEVVPAGERETWQRVLDSLPWARPVSSEAGADVVICAGTAAGEAASRALARGAGVIFRPTESAPWPAGLTGIQAPGALTTGRWAKRGLSSEGGWKLRLTQPKAELFKLFASGEFGDPARGLFHERWQAQSFPSQDILMQYDDGGPALWQGATTQGGRLWWWNLAMDPARTTWPSQSAFLPLVAEALLLCRPAARQAAHANAAPGSLVTMTPETLPEGGRVLLLDGGEREMPLQQNAAGGALAWSTLEGLPPGAFRWVLREDSTGNDHLLGWTAVNFPETETDLRLLPADAPLPGLGAAVTLAGAGSADWARLRQGTQLWPWLAAAALALLVLESLLLLPRRRAESLSSPLPSS